MYNRYIFGVKLKLIFQHIYPRNYVSGTLCWVRALSSQVWWIHFLEHVWLPITQCIRANDIMYTMVEVGTFVKWITSYITKVPCCRPTLPFWMILVTAIVVLQRSATRSQWLLFCLETKGYGTNQNQKPTIANFNPQNETPLQYQIFTN